MRKKAKLIIKSKSDLCIGSGYAYAGIIDSDIFYDEIGVPYIPAKRIRGCMRDCAETLLYSLIEDEKVRAIFGVSGSSERSSLEVSNAYIKDYNEIKKELSFAISRGVVSEQEVLGAFTHVLGQTRIGEDGSADDSSLRYTRVANQYKPFGDKAEIIYVSDISFDEEFEEEIITIAKALRNIGSKRNRGLGSIECSIVSIEVGTECIAEKKALSEGASYTLNYTVRNTAPLMLSATSDNESAKYINGQSVLGFVAGCYLKSGGNAESEGFKDLCLNGATVYSNLYPSKEIDGEYKVFYPAPLFINKEKQSGNYVNMLTKPEIQPGNQSKKIKGKFVNWSSDQVEIKDVDMQVAYHHSRRNKNSKGKQGLLYSQEVVSAGQTFSGSITTNGKYIKYLEDLFKEGAVLTFGKSRNSQYGRCEVVNSSVIDDTESACKRAENSKKTTSVVSFLSEGLIINEFGNYTVDKKSVADYIAREAGLGTKAVLVDAGIQTKLVTGYLGVWNMRKQPIPAIAAGSYFVFEDAECCDDFVTNIGERCLEGYGQIRVQDVDSIKSKLCNLNVEETTDSTIRIDVCKDLISKLMIEKLFRKSLYNQADKLAQKMGGGKDEHFDASQIGRFTLMLKESIQSEEKSEAIFCNFANRVVSVKTDKIRERAKTDLLSLVGKERDNKWVLDQNTFIKSLELDENDKQSLRCILGESYQELILDRWSDYLMEILIEMKYQLKIGKEW